MPARSAADAFYVLKHTTSTLLAYSLLARLFEVVKPVARPLRRAQRATSQWDDNEDCLIMLPALKAHADYLITETRGLHAIGGTRAHASKWLALKLSNATAQLHAGRTPPLAIGPFHRRVPPPAPRQQEPRLDYQPGF